MISWVFNVGVIVIFSSVIFMILPSGRMKKTVNGILSLIVSITIISPILSLKLDNMDLFMEIEELEYQFDFLEYIDDEKIIFLERECENVLLSIGIDNSKVDIQKLSVESDEKIVFINLKNAVIISNNEHIDIIDRTKDVVSSYLQVKKENIVIER